MLELLIFIASAAVLIAAAWIAGIVYADRREVREYEAARRKGEQDGR